MSKMRAVQVTGPNGPLEIVEREIPEPAAGLVRIKIEACGICHSDAVTDSQVEDPAAKLLKLGGARLILATATSGKAMSAVLGGLTVNGKLIILGAVLEPVEAPAIPLIFGRRSILGWPSGSSIDSQDTLSFSLLTGVRAMSEIFPLERAAEAYEHMMSGKARFRPVLTTAN